MKRVMLGIVLLIFGTVGCIPTTQQIETLTNDVDKLMVAVDDYQEKFAGEVDQVQEHIILVNEAVKKKADEGLVEQLVATNEASRPFNPYADEVSAILGLVTVIGGIWVKGKIDEKNKINSKYQAHKQGVEKTMKEVSSSSNAVLKAVEAQLYENIGEARADLGVV